MKDHYTMNLDKQIKYYDDCIARLEECIRKGSGDLSRLSVVLVLGFVVFGVVFLGCLTP